MILSISWVLGAIFAIVALIGAAAIARSGAGAKRYAAVPVVGSASGPPAPKSHDPRPRIQRQLTGPLINVRIKPAHNQVEGIFAKIEPVPAYRSRGERRGLLFGLPLLGIKLKPFMDNGVSDFIEPHS